MPLTILIALVVIGIAGIAVLTYWLGLSRPKTFASDSDVRAAWFREFSDIPVTHVTLCQSGNGALVQTPNGPGLVWAMGVDSTARFLTGASLSATDTGMRIDLPDYSAPHVTLRLTPTEITQWTGQIGAAI
ncbi:MAG: hypothetical protein ACRBB0_02640 [Pelagimonas sp.]|uniref:hypothetical protein n=1 Tax=Pelagimonas sp. TaxID=2073170 RepID=UPI003D6C2E9D